MFTINKKKKVYLLLFSLLAIFSLFSNFVFADHIVDGPLPDIIEDTAHFLFFDLSGLMKSSEDAFVIYSKFIFFLLVFTVVYLGAAKVLPPENKRIAMVLSVIFGLISTILIPAKMLVFIFETYSFIIGFFFALAPFILGLIISHKLISGDEKWKSILRGIIYIAMGLISLALAGTLGSIDEDRGGESGLYDSAAGWASVGGVIALVWGVIALFGGLGKGQVEPVAEKVSGMWPFRNKTEEEKTKDEEEKNEEAQIKLTAVEIKDIKEIHKAILKLKTDLDEDVTTTQDGNNVDWDNKKIEYDKSIDALIVDLNELKAMDEMVEKYAKKLYEEAKEKIRKRLKGGAEQMRIAREVTREYRTDKLIEKMVLKVEVLLNETKGLPKILGGLPGYITHGPYHGAPYTPPGPLHIPARNESTILQESLDEVKLIHNMLVRVFKNEKKTLKEIA